MTPEELKTRIKEKGLSQRRLARRIRVSMTAINFFVNGTLKSNKIEKGMARALGLTPEELRGEGKAA